MAEEEGEKAEVVRELSPLAIHLLKGVIYRESEPGLWLGLLNLQGPVRDYVAVLGLELLLDEAEGYAFLRARTVAEEDPAARLPRLVARRPLSYPVSLILALLRKKLAESDASGGETRLVLTRDEITELVRVFLAESSNEAKVTDQIESYLVKIVELGFLRRLKTGNASPGGQAAVFEVRRIIKAFVDGQWLNDFAARLEAYRQGAGVDSGEAVDEE